VTFICWHKWKSPKQSAWIPIWPDICGVRARDSGRPRSSGRFLLDWRRVPRRVS